MEDRFGLLTYLLKTVVDCALEYFAGALKETELLGELWNVFLIGEGLAVH